MSLSLAAGTEKRRHEVRRKFRGKVVFNVNDAEENNKGINLETKTEVSIGG